jgi:hypothetical protein
LDLSKPLGTIWVLDLETRPDQTAHRIARRTDGSISNAMRSIRNFSILEAHEGEDGRWERFNLHTHGRPDEFDVLMELDEHLARAEQEGAALCTYNGATHDLPLIRRRAAAHWMFGLVGLRAPERLRHVDLFQRNVRGDRGQWPSLKELCATYTIPTDHHVVLRDREGADAGERKSEVDVVATFIVLLFETAMIRGSDNVLVSGWSALIDHLAAAHPHTPHLQQFAQSRALRSRTEGFADD